MAKFKLMVSQNLGCSYQQEYETDDINDPALRMLMQQCNEDIVRYYVEGAEEIMCPLHGAVVQLLGGKRTFGRTTTIEEKAEQLKQHFCK